MVDSSFNILKATAKLQETRRMLIPLPNYTLEIRSEDGYWYYGKEGEAKRRLPECTHLSPLGIVCTEAFYQVLINGDRNLAPCDDFVWWRQRPYEPDKIRVERGNTAGPVETPPAKSVDVCTTNTARLQATTGSTGCATELWSIFEEKRMGYSNEDANGVEVYLIVDGKIVEELVPKDALKEGTEVACPSLFGYFQATVRVDSYGVFYADSKDMIGDLFFSGDARQCWSSRYSVHKSALRKISELEIKS